MRRRSTASRATRRATSQEAAKLRERSRATVLAAVERGGRVKATVLPSRRGPQLKEKVIESGSGRSRSSIPTTGWPTRA